MKHISRLVPILVAALFGAGAGGVAVYQLGYSKVATEPSDHQDDEDHGGRSVNAVVLTDQAIKNLGVFSAPVSQESVWRTLQIPAIIVDRPGHSDRSIAAPAASVVATIHQLPGTVISPGQPLFTLRLVGESLHQAQTELFKATQEISLARSRRTRMEGLTGTVPMERLIEIDEQIARLRVTAQASKQELLTRGLSDEQIQRVAAGSFVTEVVVAAPSSPADYHSVELQELNVSLGQQVQAGQTLCVLADHRHLAVEGRAFRDDLQLLQNCIRQGWPVQIDFMEGPPADRIMPAALAAVAACPQPLQAAALFAALDADGRLPPIQRFDMIHLANSIDPVERTISFWIPLHNQYRFVSRSGPPQRLWRFRPGQKLMLHVPIERLDGVLVLPPDAVVQDGAESFAFVQNVNTFEQVSVRVLVRERTRVIVADEGAFPTGVYVARRGAAVLNRLLKGRSGDVPKGYHMHADGSLHRNGDPEE